MSLKINAVFNLAMGKPIFLSYHEDQEANQETSKQLGKHASKQARKHADKDKREASGIWQGDAFHYGSK